MGMERKAFVTGVALAVLACTGARAGCKDLAAEIENAQKQMADDEVRLRDEATKRARQSNQLAAIQANLMLMDRAKCAMPMDPISADGIAAYGKAAGKCMMRDAAPDDCRRELWRRSPQ